MARTSGGLTQHDPRRRVVARSALAAYLAVDAGFRQARRKLWAEEEMIQSQARVALPAVALVVPEGEHRLRGMQAADRIRPALLNQRCKCGAAFRLDQRILVP